MQARARSEQIRRETLLIEHQQKGRTNSFLDGRFGENDEGMPIEDKLVVRFQRERQRQLKQSKYSLEDEDGGRASFGGGNGSALGAPGQLTHHGQSLGDLDNFSDTGLGDSDDEGGGRGGRGKGDASFEGADFIKRAHFGGGDDADAEGDGGRRLSAKELLEETIAKYKMAKFERQDVKKEQAKEIDQLDADFDDIRQLVFQTSASSKKAAVAAEKAKSRGEPPVSVPVSSLVSHRSAVSGGGPSQHADFEKLANGAFAATASERLPWPFVSDRARARMHTRVAVLVPPSKSSF